MHIFFTIRLGRQTTLFVRRGNKFAIWFPAKREYIYLKYICIFAFISPPILYLIEIYGLVSKRYYINLEILLLWQFRWYCSHVNINENDLINYCVLFLIYTIENTLCTKMISLSCKYPSHWKRILLKRRLTISNAWLYVRLWFALTFRRTFGASKINTRNSSDF